MSQTLYSFLFYKVIATMDQVDTWWITNFMKYTPLIIKITSVTKISIKIDFLTTLDYTYYDVVIFEILLLNIITIKYYVKYTVFSPNI